MIARQAHGPALEPVALGVQRVCPPKFAVMPRHDLALAVLVEVDPRGVSIGSPLSSTRREMHRGVAFALRDLSRRALLPGRLSRLVDVGVTLAELAHEDEVMPATVSGVHHQLGVFGGQAGSEHRDLGRRTSDSRRSRRPAGYLRRAQTMTRRPAASTGTVRAWPNDGNLRLPGTYRGIKALVPETERNAARYRAIP